jgi:catechol 2,3-dioxygenase-like lactoylglutathione lyase family enzyme
VAAMLLALLPLGRLPAQSMYPSGGAGVVIPAAGSESTAARAVARVGLTVSDMEQSIGFYTRVLGFEKVSDIEVAGASYEKLEGVFGVRMRVVRLRLGEETLELTEYLAPRGRPAPVDSRSNDRWFQHVAIIVSDMDSAYARLRSFRVQHASTGPQLLPRTIPNAAGIRAFYFKDPDNHPLEILWFPADKGSPRWHQADRGLFLGIDHTAIAIASTARSLRFYHDLLGLEVKGESHNFGDEQAHLNNVEGAELHITGLRAAAGPGIEFLEYLNPRDGRPYPADERANDLVHWQTTIVMPDLDAAARRLGAAGGSMVSPGIVPVADTGLGFTRGFLARDPDGHAVLVVDR